jgi:integrase
VDDVSLRHDKVWFRPNQWRLLKTRGSKRSVPLWPQLKEILSAYLMERERTGGLGTLLFPSARSAEEKMIRDVRKALDHIGTRAGFPKGHIRLHMLRHTYASQRIQTCDRGRPVAMYTVARELGHRSTTMLEDRYGHLHDRTEGGGIKVVEFRIECHREQIPQEKLEAVR